MSSPPESDRARSAPQPMPQSQSFAAAFAQVVLVFLAALVLLCDALPAIGAALPVSLEPGSGPAASLFGLLLDYFWPGTITLHAGLAALWLACGRARISVKLLGVLLSMNLRAVWAWVLYGVNEPDLQQLGEPVNVSGAPLWMFGVSLVISLTLWGQHFARAEDAARRPQLQIVDLLAWTASAAIFLALLLAFGRGLTRSILAERLYYSGSLLAAWAVFTFFSAWWLREWLITDRWGIRFLRMTVLAAFFVVACGGLIASARLVAEWGPEDMAVNILAYLAPSTFLWCMATGWALRELGLRIERKPAPATL